MPPSSEVQTAATTRRISIGANRLFVEHPECDRTQHIYMRPRDAGPMFEIAHCSIRHFLTEAPLNRTTNASYIFDVDINVPGEQDPTPITLCLIKNAQLTLGLVNSSLSPICGRNVQLFKPINKDEKFDPRNFLQISFEEIEAELKRVPTPFY
jgi:hypothetical protein